MSDYFKDNELLAIETAIRGDQPDAVVKLETRVKVLENLVKQLVGAVNELPTAFNLDRIGVTLEALVEATRRNS